MKKTQPTPNFIKNTRHPRWAGVSILVLFALAYSLPALTSPYWVGNDAWSNLLPVIHFRDSILHQHSLPLYTDLWYGGRAQWANPLWNFPYLPSTLLWLALPLDWGTRAVYFGHLLFILLAARKLASLFLLGEIEKISAAILLSSPALPAFTAGHTEKILSWGWILLGLYFLLDGKKNSARRGFTSGICLAVVPLSGSNYYALYAGILFTLLAVSFKDKKLLMNFLAGAALGLIHLPSVWHLVGAERANAQSSIIAESMSMWGIFTSLAIGLAKPLGWESWAPIGIPAVYLFFKSIFTRRAIAPREKTLLIALLLFALLATALAYRGHSLLDTFRVPARAISFIALSATLFLLVSSQTNQRGLRPLLLLSALQVVILSLMIQPRGAPYSPYDKQAQQLADVLKADHTQSLWISMRGLNEMYIHAVLNQNGIRLPNVYYGDMGQDVPIEGTHCGYSFDHLAVQSPPQGEFIEIVSDMEWSKKSARIPLKSLQQVATVKVHGASYEIYRVICPP